MADDEWEVFIIYERLAREFDARGLVGEPFGLEGRVGASARHGIRGRV